MDLPFAITTPMREATTNTLPRFNVPAGACDTHFHVFEEGYAHVPDPQYTFPEATLEQYIAMTDFLGIERMVIVQPTFYGDDNSLTLEALHRLGDRARGVVRVPDTVATAELDRYDAAGVRAIRLDLFARRDWPAADLHAYIRSMAALAKPLGWHLQFYSPGPVVRDLLPFLAELDIDVVIDHMGYMKKSDGLGDADFAGLLAALDAGNTWIKLTGPYRLAGDEPLASVEPVGRALVATRADRLLWGTDWPHLPNGQRDTGELLGLLADWAPDAADRETILVTSPDRLFFAH
ncbi:MAG TPA: amidohydrolase family protein [Pseudolysinimonas sp.]|jgi:predicted TIM-barrel fold metal-dependent hydrolase|nr:amidohydrolase family protein [Pseudolysinimonas sp.]